MRPALGDVRISSYVYRHKCKPTLIVAFGFVYRGDRGCSFENRTGQRVSAIGPARDLVNGKSICRESWVEEVTYFHLEFERHANTLCGGGHHGIAGFDLQGFLFASPAFCVGPGGGLAQDRCIILL